MPMQEMEIPQNQPMMPRPPEEPVENDRRSETGGEESYWWHAPWGEVRRVTRNEQRTLMRQWVEGEK